MNEQRLIDANLLLKEAEESLCENPHTGVMAQAMHTHEHRHFMCMILHQTIIDPETLPVVQQLRAELARMTEERDAAVADLKTICDCDYCENDCVNIEEDYCEFCEVEGCLCRGCISGGNWTWRGPRKEAKND